MPLYEYACDACGHRFERLVRVGEAPESCPRCDAEAPRKLFSAFAVAKEGPSFEPGACGTCGDPRGPGACSMDWDN